MSIAIHVANLSKTFTRADYQVEAIHDLSIDIGVGEFLCIVGPSGCGKTTFLRILAGLETKSSGEVDFCLAPSARPLLSIVFQEQGVFPWMTVLDNVAFGLAVRGVGVAERYQLARYYLDRVGLRSFEKAYPRQLSGGMRQRVNIARAFTNDPEILLMDEPFANLDEQTKLLLQEDLLKIWEESRKTVVYITHSIEEAARLGDRILVMTHRPGKIKTLVQVGISRPRDVFALESSQELARIRGGVWSALKDEVLRARREEERGT